MDKSVTTYDKEPKKDDTRFSSFCPLSEHADSSSIFDMLGYGLNINKNVSTNNNNQDFNTENNDDEDMQPNDSDLNSESNYDIRLDGEDKSKVCYLEKEMKMGNMIDLSFMLDHFYKEPIAFPENNEDPRKSKKFLRSVLTQMIASINDDMRKAKL